MPKKYVVVKFTSLPDPMCGIRCNKKTFSVDVTEDTYAGGKRWVLVFYGLNSKLLYYYRLGFKKPYRILDPRFVGSIQFRARGP